MRCPKCGHEQGERADCERCGVVFERLRGSRPPRREAAPSAGPPLTTPAAKRATVKVVPPAIGLTLGIVVALWVAHAWTHRSQNPAEKGVGAVATAGLPAGTGETHRGSGAQSPTGEIWVITDHGCAFEADGRALGEVKKYELQAFQLAPGPHGFRCVQLHRAPGDTGEWTGRDDVGLRHPTVVEVRYHYDDPNDEGRRAELIEDARDARYARLESAAEAAGFHDDAQSGLGWAHHDNGAEVSWIEADAYCQGLTTGDFDDWRLPVIEELTPIQGSISGNVTLPVHAGSRLWTSSRAESGSRNMILFNFDRSIREIADIVTSHARALCVRGGNRYAGLAPLSEAEIDGRVEEVRDAAVKKETSEAARAEYGRRHIEALRQGFARDPQTGLTWAPHDSTEPLTPSAAEEYCRNFVAGRVAGWRLPNLRELDGIFVPHGSDAYRNADNLRLPIDLRGYDIWSSERPEPNPDYPNLERAWAYRFLDCDGENCHPFVLGGTAHTLCVHD